MPGEALSLDCLVVDDDPTIRLCLEHMIRDNKHRASSTTDGAAALHLVSEHRYDVVISDIRMPKLDGLSLFQHIHQVSPATSVILMTAYATVPDAVAALKLGVYEYIGKPVNGEEFRVHLERIAEKRALSGLEQARDKLSGRDAGPYLIIGHSPPILKMLEMVDTLAATDASVLITGESGTGKELLARALQASSRRRDQPFVSVNCAAFPESLLSGAVRPRKGRLHRRGRKARRTLHGGRRRHAAARRDWRDAAARPRPSCFGCSRTGRSSPSGPIRLARSTCLPGRNRYHHRYQFLGDPGRQRQAGERVLEGRQLRHDRDGNRVPGQPPRLRNRHPGQR